MADRRQSAIANPFPGLRPLRARRRPPLLRPRARGSTTCCGACGARASSRSSAPPAAASRRWSARARSRRCYSGFMARRRLQLARRPVPPRRGPDRPPGRRARRSPTCSAPPRRGERHATAPCSTLTLRRSSMRPRRGGAPGARAGATRTCSWSSTSSRSCSASTAARQQRDSRDEAVAFVKLLLRARYADELSPSTSCSRCAPTSSATASTFPGLPEAINDGQYLVPRMTRDELRGGDHRPGRRRRGRDHAAAGARGCSTTSATIPTSCRSCSTR